ncbi:hemagglutinin [Pectobacterium polaris]|uniref:hemagglutinin n=1 Tax=Pectobacterium polaris TaxID=2042057 RepID=UPI001F42EAA6|nr:hemagglutinin [Pectobacterium polaris]
MTFLRKSTESPYLYLSDSASGGIFTTAYLLPANVVGPQTLSLSDAITATGWFIFIPGLASAGIDAFVTAAQIYFANSARAGAFAAWFQDISNPAAGLSGMVIYGTRAAGQVTTSRSALIQGANLSVNIDSGSVIAASGDGLSLTISGSDNSASVTPYGSRQPYQLPWLSGGAINILGPIETSGCFQFSVSVSDTTASQLDVGLRSYTAPVGGGYAQSAAHKFLNFGTSGVTLPMTLDPLNLFNHQRSFAGFSASQAPLTSTYRTAVGDTVVLTPTSSAALVFTDRLIAVDANSQPVVLPGNRITAMMPSGDFTVSVPTGKQESGTDAAPNLSATLMCGLSAVEYLDLTAAGTLSFVPDQPAFAPTIKAATGTGPSDTKRVFGQVTDAGRTSWAYLSVVEGSRYFAQPDSSVLHNGPGDAATPFLNYLPVELGTLPPAVTLSEALDAEILSFPLMPYAAVTAGTGLTTDDIAQFELQSWAPRRKALIQQSVNQTNTTVSGSGATLPTPPYGTTPQGLLLEFTQAGSQLGWGHLTLGNSPSTPPPNRADTVVLSSVTGALKNALQTNQLALVMMAGEQFAACGSFPYVLTQERYLVLQQVITDQAVITAIAPLVVGVTPISGKWPDETALNAALQGVLTTDQYNTWAQTIRTYTGDFSLFVAGWEFDLSPWRWADHNSIVIFKFCRKQLTQIIADTTQWTEGDTFNTSTAASQKIISDFFDDTLARFNKGDTDLSYFVNTVMLDPNWNGILVLNGEVPLSGLPPQLEGLAAGIDASQFKAHHLGITVTPVQTGSTQYQTTASSAFGLIDYSSPAPLSGSQPYDYKVLSLKVLIANSNVASFSSSIELLINQLFGEPSNQQNANDNNLTLYGTYQKSGGVESYSFTSNGATAYLMSSSTLYMVNIETASFITVTSGADDPNDTTVNSRFQLNGSVSFLPQPGFDLFSYGPEQPIIDIQGIGGGLAYSALAIDMTFDQASPTYRTFVFDATKILLDQGASQVRALSLAAHFPMKLMGLVQAVGDVTPDSMGFMPVDSPIQGSPLTAPWFGLQFELDLGSLGALAAEAGFTASLMLGWAPNVNGTTNYIGLSMPGVSGGDRAISLQGVLKLAFGDVSFLVSPPTYILQLKNIALKFLSLTFPPNGQINMLMFGNPDAQTSGALGWYASYLKNGAGQPSGNGKTVTGVNRLKATAHGDTVLIAPQHAIKKLENKQ